MERVQKKGQDHARRPELGMRLSAEQRESIARARLRQAERDGRTCGGAEPDAHAEREHRPDVILRTKAIVRLLELVAEKGQLEGVIGKLSERLRYLHYLQEALEVVELAHEGRYLDAAKVLAVLAVDAGTDELFERVLAGIVPLTVVELEVAVGAVRGAREAGEYDNAFYLFAGAFARGYLDEEQSEVGAVTATQRAAIRAGLAEGRALAEGEGAAHAHAKEALLARHGGLRGAIGVLVDRKLGELQRGRGLAFGGDEGPRTTTP